MPNQSLAPIVLFVYNRPWHTEQTLNALMQNELANQSVLFIYADGIKESANKEELKNIQDVRQIIRGTKWCKEVTIVESEINKGLADSIIEGVTKVVNKFGKIIVLEDDIVTSKGFLRYMNDALNIYENEEMVFHVSGYMFPVKKKLPDTFFYNTASCWGWGTWKRAWLFFNNDPDFLLSSIENRSLKKEFNIDDSYDFYGQLEANKNGSLKTWAVKWYASFFLQKGFALHPYPSLTNNIGHDGLGENCGISNLFNWKDLASSISIKKNRLKENTNARKAMHNFNKTLGYHQPKIYSKNLKKFFRSKITYFIPERMKHIYRTKNNAYYRLQEEKIQEEKRILSLPRFTEGKTNLLGNTIDFIDSASFLFINDEIFNKQIYRFNCTTEEPYIIDCGANIGLSIIYFKQLFPKAEIIGFEPDEKVYKVLQHNSRVFNLKNVQLIKKACWNDETVLRFFSEGADGGRVAGNTDNRNIIEVETTRLRRYLKKRVDFLKIDIEGAENEVLNDVQDLLTNVDKIFVEFHSFIGKEQMLPEILTILKHAGFRLHISSPGLISPTPFIEVKSYANMDNQLNIYGVR
jgi:FkbM family methyltransferase